MLYVIVTISCILNHVLDILLNTSGFYLIHPRTLRFKYDYPHFTDTINET